MILIGINNVVFGALEIFKSYPGRKIDAVRESFNNTVTLYVSRKIQESYYDYILKLNPQRVIFNPGAENVRFAEILTKNSIKWENSCTLVLLSTNQY